MGGGCAHGLGTGWVVVQGAVSGVVVDPGPLPFQGLERGCGRAAPAVGSGHDDLCAVLSRGAWGLWCKGTGTGSRESGGWGGGGGGWTRCSGW